jgi:hypothetical protein
VDEYMSRWVNWTLRVGVAFGGLSGSTCSPRYWILRIGVRPSVGVAAPPRQNPKATATSRGSGPPTQLYTASGVASAGKPSIIR